MLDTKVVELFDLLACDSDIGLEIEMEMIGRRRYYQPPWESFWRLEEDGSLRGFSGEYVLKQPINLDTVPKAVDELKKCLDNVGVTIKDSIRAGVHVHINCQQMTMRQVLIFSTFWYIVENLIVDWCGPNRVGNHFCLRACDADWVIDNMIDFYKNQNLEAVNTDAIRYAALNFTSLPKYGSLEFRCMQTTPDLSGIYEFCEMISIIKEKALEQDDPFKIIEEVSMIGANQWVKNLLGKYADEVSANFTEAEVRENAFTGLRLAQDLLYFGVGK